jgi:hypothetical protein
MAVVKGGLQVDVILSVLGGSLLKALKLEVINAQII